MYHMINDLKITIKPEVISDLKRYYYSSLKYETGGILLGKFNRINRIIEIMEVYELKIINKRWSETDGVINYVGEWHTHPYMQAIPSDTDIDSLREITAKVKDSLPGTLLIIVGRNEKINLIAQREDTIKMQFLSEGKRNGD